METAGAAEAEEVPPPPIKLDDVADSMLQAWWWLDAHGGEGEVEGGR